MKWGKPVFGGSLPLWLPEPLDELMLLASPWARGSDTAITERPLPMHFASPAPAVGDIANSHSAPAIKVSNARLMVPPCESVLVEHDSRTLTQSGGKWSAAANLER